MPQRKSNDQSKGKNKQHKRSKKVYGKGEEKAPKHVIIVKGKEKTPKHMIIAMLKMEASRSADSEACLSEVPSHTKVIQCKLKKRLPETHYSLLGHMPVPQITRRDSSTHLLLYHSNSHSPTSDTWNVLRLVLRRVELQTTRTSERQF
jgi:hypothetical protein